LSRWVKQRRLDVAIAARKFPRVPVKDQVLCETVGESGWTESHQAEADFQARKRAVRFIEAVKDKYGPLPVCY
jgi:hypothetical protein